MPVCDFSIFTNFVFLAGGLLRIKLEKNNWLLMTVMQNSLYIFLDAKILSCRFKVIYDCYRLMTKCIFCLITCLSIHGVLFYI